MSQVEEVKITVITVALNASKDLPLTISSVGLQTYRNIEYLIVDGGSWDDSPSIYKRFESFITSVFTIEDASIYDAMNRSSHLATGDYILFLNAGDTLYSADAIETMVKRLQPKVDVFYGNHIFVDKRKEYFKASSDFSTIRSALHTGSVDHHWHSRIPGHQATFTKTELLRKLPYDTSYTICADHDFLFRAYDAGAKFQYIDEIVSYYFAGGYSGLQGDLINREWAHAYRSRSLRPFNVDSLFFSEGWESPYSQFNAYSGMMVSGHLNREGPYPEMEIFSPARWIGFCEVSTPSRFSATALNLELFNNYPHQNIKVLMGGRTIALTEVPVGRSSVTLEFDEPVPPSSRLLLVPDQVARLSDTDARLAGVMVADLHFDVSLPLQTNEISADAGGADVMRSALLEGWSDIESLNGFVWSVAQSAKIAVELPFKPSTMTVECNANPHVQGAQELQIFVNGTPIHEEKLRASKRPQVISLRLGNIWREGLNAVEFRVDKVAKPPRDRRLLGIALSRVSWN